MLGRLADEQGVCRAAGVTDVVAAVLQSTRRAFCLELHRPRAYSLKLSSFCEVRNSSDLKFLKFGSCDPSEA